MTVSVKSREKKIEAVLLNVDDYDGTFKKLMVKEGRNAECSSSWDACKSFHAFPEGCA